MPVSHSLTVVFALLTPVGAATPSAQPPNGGGYCRALLRRVPPDTLWIGKFSAGREEDGDEDSGEADNAGSHAVTTEACFTRKADCERWLYKMQSMFPDEPRWRYCAPFTRQPRHPPRA